MRASLSSGAIMLDAELEKTKNLEKVSKHINDLWI
jgi:hypothetical protein